MVKEEMKSYSLAEMKDKYIGKVGTKTETIMNMNFGWRF